MMNLGSALSGEKRKYFLIGLVVVLSVAVLFQYAPEMRSAVSTEGEAGLMARQLAKYREAVRKKDRLQAALVQVERSLTQAESGLLTGNTKAIAAVDIQNILNALAEQSGVRFKTIRVLPPAGEETAAYLPIPVQITFDASIRQVKEIVYRIESAARLLRIPEARIRMANPKTPEIVQAVLTVEGFMKPPEGGGETGEP